MKRLLGLGIALIALKITLVSCSSFLRTWFVRLTTISFSLYLSLYIYISLVNFDFYARLLHNNVHISGFIPRHLPNTLVRQLRQLTLTPVGA